VKDKTMCKKSRVILLAMIMLPFFASLSSPAVSHANGWEQVDSPAGTVLTSTSTSTDTMMVIDLQSNNSAILDGSPSCRAAANLSGSPSQALISASVLCGNAVDEINIGIEISYKINDTWHSIGTDGASCSSYSRLDVPGPRRSYRFGNPAYQAIRVYYTFDACNPTGCVVARATRIVGSR